MRQQKGYTKSPAYHSRDEQVRALVGLGLTLRDIAPIMGVSYQRVHQIVRRLGLHTSDPLVIRAPKHPKAADPVVSEYFRLCSMVRRRCAGKALDGSVKAWPGLNPADRRVALLRIAELRPKLAAFFASRRTGRDTGEKITAARRRTIAKARKVVEANRARQKRLRAKLLTKPTSSAA